MRWLDGTTGQIPVGGEGQGSLACYSPRVRHDLVTEQQQRKFTIHVNLQNILSLQYIYNI